MITKPGKKGPTAEEVVADAKSPKSPVHKFFDWNDKTAGHKWRVYHARVLMGSVVPIYHNGQKIEIRAFKAVKIISSGEREAQTAKEQRAKQYVEIQSIKSDKVLKAQITVQCFCELLNTLKKFKQYADWWPDFQGQCAKVEQVVLAVSGGKLHAA